MSPGRQRGSVEIRPTAPDQLCLVLAGDWRPGSGGVPESAPLLRALGGAPPPRRVFFESSGVTEWGSGLISYLLQCQEVCEAAGIAVDDSGLPEGIRQLVHLARSAPPAAAGSTPVPAPTWVERVGVGWLATRVAVRESVGFVGECALAATRWLRGETRLRRADFLWLLQGCGADALPIVGLIAFLVGLILAFVGAVQLMQFGAAIYVADLVAIAVVREMGAMMTAIILCGRTGAAYAAQLGTMKVNQELDAFAVFGIPAIDFLVFPRLLALVLMFPLLTLFADLIGILGGFVVAMAMLDLSFLEYGRETLLALTVTQVNVGLAKSLVFGLIVGLSGCLRGMQCGTNAAAVGQATTSAVVTGITWIIVADAVFAVGCNILGV